MDNKEFLDILKKSFYKYLTTSPRSNKKLEILHGAIAKDLANRLGDEYTVHSLGYMKGKEKLMSGRYMNKKVDIAVEKDGKVLAGIALKFIMSNYSQNSNNYFENMLGETANIRTNGGLYFEIVIIPMQVPYFEKEGKIKKYENITRHNIEKYIKLSQDNVDIFLHTPNKTLIYLVDFSKLELKEINSKESYKNYYITNKDFKVKESTDDYIFGSAIVYNNYEKFIDKVYHSIKSL